MLLMREMAVDKATFYVKCSNCRRKSRLTYSGDNGLQMMFLVYIVNSACVKCFSLSHFLRHFYFCFDGNRFTRPSPTTTPSSNPSSSTTPIHSSRLVAKKNKNKKCKRRLEFYVRGVFFKSIFASYLQSFPFSVIFIENIFVSTRVRFIHN